MKSWEPESGVYPRFVRKAATRLNPRQREAVGYTPNSVGGEVRVLPELFENNRRWAAACVARQPDFFSKLKSQQAPEYLWIGCSDSRVPANEIVGLRPGELFVHRNVANVVVYTDLNCLSVLQYAVDVLRVKHVIVCGHYGCGGVLAALRSERLGLIDNWLRHVEDLHARHRPEISTLPTESQRHRRLCELNVIEQVVNAGKTTVVRNAWMQGKQLAVHGWIYDLHDGIIRDLEITITSESEISRVAETARARLAANS
jgi:carbonic anhydrase